MRMVNPAEARQEPQQPAGRNARDALALLMSDCVMEEDSRMLLNAGKICYLSMMHQLQSLRIVEHDLHVGIIQVMLDAPRERTGLKAICLPAV